MKKEKEEKPKKQYPNKYAKVTSVIRDVACSLVKRIAAVFVFLT